MCRCVRNTLMLSVSLWWVLCVYAMGTESIVEAQEPQLEGRRITGTVEYQDTRRVGEAQVLLRDQDRARWDHRAPIDFLRSMTETF